MTSNSGLGLGLENFLMGESLDHSNFKSKAKKTTKQSDPQTQLSPGAGGSADSQLRQELREREEVIGSMTKDMQEVESAHAAVS